MKLFALHLSLVIFPALQFLYVPCIPLLNNNEYPELMFRSTCNIFMVQGDLLQVKVNKLTSTKTQLPYSFYSLPYCTPEKIVDSAENLGEVLRGDRIENSKYVVSFIWHVITCLDNCVMFINWFTQWLACSLKCANHKCAMLCARLNLMPKLPKRSKRRLMMSIGWTCMAC